MRSGEEIQRALRAFSVRWASYSGSEKSEAQTFLNELFECYGSNRLDVGARFEDFVSSAGFMDLHWPEVCIVEMKRPGTPVDKAREQVKRYWEESADDDHPAAQWVVLCSFQQFEVWEPGRYPKSARARFSLNDLPSRYETLAFLAGPNQVPSFLEHHKALTTESAKLVAKTYHSLADRSAAPLDEIQRFTMQAVWCMFAEDLGLLDGSPFQNTVDRLRRDPTRSSAAELGHLFTVLNQKGNHNRKDLLSGTRYVNGELFARPAAVDLIPDELYMLAVASEMDWSKVDPTIFGSLMEMVIGQERRWERGAHYTHETDIMKIVGPTIVRPWQARIDAVADPAAGRELLDELCAFRVLDPACGCGNFLYVAYRELRGLEWLLKERIRDIAHTTGLPMPPEPWPYFPLSNMHGIEIEPVSVLISRVTLWMGHRQMIDKYGAAENPLPLVTLSTIKTGDALRVPWPEVECIVGNPPFMGSQLIRRSLGDEYAEWLSGRFGVGVKDLCTYWFRIAHDHLREGQRAGLVGTNSISQNRARSASLQYIVDNGGTITDAVSSQKWPGEAKVHVSLVDWVKGSFAGPFVIDGAEVKGGIDASLRPAGDWIAKELKSNSKRCFQGPIPVGDGFIISAAQARALLETDLEGRSYSDVIKRYMTGDDLADDPAQTARRWVIDFGTMALEEAEKYPEAIGIVRWKVKPEREENADAGFRKNWWQFGRPRKLLRAQRSRLARTAAVARHGKRVCIAWCDEDTIASDATNTFAFDDDYSMGVLQSRAHVAWAWHTASTLKGDLRYTPSSVFMTFPWPDKATATQRDVVAEACRAVLSRRSEICTAEQIGLTTLYNLMDDGAYADLRALHKRLDEAVAACYGWPKKVAQDDTQLVARLLTLNREIVEGARAYHPFEYLEPST